MKLTHALLMWSLAGPMAVLVNANGGQRSSSPRNFRSFVREKIRSVCREVTELKQTVGECCNKELQDCMEDGKTYNHGAVFSATDGCSTCVCNNGAVDCTNATGCDQEDTSYNYKDILAQGYCASKMQSSKMQFPDYVSAVRRNCGDPGAGEPPTCDVICGPGSQFATNITSRFPDASLNSFFCINALWVMMDHSRLEPNPGPGQPDAGLLNLVTVSHAYGCADTGSDCGPNYCCCIANKAS